MPNGSKYWRLRYFIGDKEKLLALGVYPEVSLSDALDGHANRTRKILATGRDPAQERKTARKKPTETRRTRLNALPASGMKNVCS